jgi:hypothetical protein
MAILQLGDFVFDQHTFLPESIREGGPEQHQIHRQPGGARTIDILGRNDNPFEWNGTFMESVAEVSIRQLDAMRVAGLIYNLQFGTIAQDVVITKLEWHYRRTNWIDYTIECTQVFNADAAAGAGAANPAGDVGAAGAAGGAGLG